MSYDYNALVHDFVTHRRQSLMVTEEEEQGPAQPSQSKQQHSATKEVSLRKALCAVETLAKHCPLTPLLWLQYAATVRDTTLQSCLSSPSLDKDDNPNHHSNYHKKYRHKDSTTQSSSGYWRSAHRAMLATLQQGLGQFPGSALLHVRTVCLATQLTADLARTAHDRDLAMALATLERIVQQAVEAVGQGSHAKSESSSWVSLLYRVWARVVSCGKQHESHSPSKPQQPHTHYRLSATAAVWVHCARTPAGRDVPAAWRKESRRRRSRSCSRNKTTRTSNIYLERAWDDGRRIEAQRYAQFITYQDDIDVALHQDGALARVFPEFQRQRSSMSNDDDSDDDDIENDMDDGTSPVKKDNDKVDITTNERSATVKVLSSVSSYWSHLDWTAMEQPCDQTYGMGLGSPATARAFVQFARALQHPKALPPVDEEDTGDGDSGSNKGDPNWGTTRADWQARYQSLALRVYERGVAECPVVEAIWLAYIRDLTNLLTYIPPSRATSNDSSRALAQTSRRHAATILTSVVTRAVRNCPQSVALAHQSLSTVSVLSSLSLLGPPTDPLPIVVAEVVDPDALLDQVDERLDDKFLPTDPMIALDLYLQATRVVKRRILVLLAASIAAKTAVGREEKQQMEDSTEKKTPRWRPLQFDDSEPLESVKKTNFANQTDDDAEKFDEDLQEAKDLVEDMDDMYEEVESRLKKRHANWTLGRALLGRERERTTALLLNPLRANFASSTESLQKDNAIESDEQLQSLSRCIRAHNPPHPDLYARYIDGYMTSVSRTGAAQTWSHVVMHLRRVRGLYERALSSVGEAKPKKKSHAAMESSPRPSSLLPSREYSTALSSLCHDWLEFERIFGSDRSLGKASKVIDKKLQKAAQNNTRTVPNTQLAKHAVLPGHAKRKLSEINTDTDAIDNHDPGKKAKVTDGSIDHVADDPNVVQRETTTDSTIAENEVVPPCNVESVPQQHKVRVGTMEYPAHPFTVRVSNLRSTVQEMDLVDLFRLKCGAIVHAKVFRDKHTQASKGYGLVQFEERIAVESALGLDDTIGIHEQLVRVERSHMPAVSLVPPGMHRVKPKGEGKASKRNEKRKQQQKQKQLHSNAGSKPTLPQHAELSTKTSAPATNASKESNKSTPVVNVAAFRPRGVRLALQKPKIQLDGGISNNSKNNKHGPD